VLQEGLKDDLTGIGILVNQSKNFKTDDTTEKNLKQTGHFIACD